MARECSFRRSSVSTPAASCVPDVSVPDPVAGLDPAMSEDEDDPDYVPSSTSEPGLCSSDEEVLRSVPTSVLAARAQKRSAPPADESSVYLRDNELSPASDPVASDAVPDSVPGTPESASAVVTSDPVTASTDPVPDPVPGTPVSASAVFVPDSTPVPKPKKRKPRPPQDAAASVPAESTPVESTPVPVASTPVTRLPRRTFWEATRRTGFGFTVDDGTGAFVYLDFGRLSRSIEIESTTFEYDRFVKYVHHGVGRVPARPPHTVYLSTGTPLEFPKPQK